MFRNVAFALIFIAVLLFAIAFAAMNPGVITLDVGLGRTEIHTSLALSVAFAAGWCFGILSLGFAVLRLWLDRRRLQASLRLAEAEVQALRRLPVEHAD